MCICISLLSLGCVITAVSAGADYEESTHFTIDDNGYTTSIMQDSYFVLELPENPTTGYEWDLNVSDGLEVLFSDYYAAPESENMAGVGGTHRWYIYATKDGVQTVSAVYKQAGAPASDSDATYSLTLNVIHQEWFPTDPAIGI